MRLSALWRRRLMILRSLSSAPRLSSSTLARYSSMVLGLAFRRSLPAARRYQWHRVPADLPAGLSRKPERLVATGRRNPTRLPQKPLHSPLSSVGPPQRSMRQTSMPRIASFGAVKRQSDLELSLMKWQRRHIFPRIGYPSRRSLSTLVLRFIDVTFVAFRRFSVLRYRARDQVPLPPYSTRGRSTGTP